MAPKLSYTSIKKEQKSQRSIPLASSEDISSSDLFSHMNQDNLKYINNQIKKKKVPSLELMEQNPSAGTNHKIEERSQQYESTSRELLKEKSEMDEYIAKTEYEQQIHMNSESDVMNREPQRNKVSFYDLISQAKSKKLTSQNDRDKTDFLDQSSFGKDNAKGIGKNSKMVEFIDSYVSHLEQEPSKQKNRAVYEQYAAIVESLKEDNVILIESLHTEKKKNVKLAKYIESYEQQSEKDARRIRQLQRNLAILQSSIHSIKQEYTRRKHENRESTNNHNRVKQLQDEYLQFERTGILKLNSVSK